MYMLAPIKMKLNFPRRKWIFLTCVHFCIVELFSRNLCSTYSLMFKWKGNVYYQNLTNICLYIISIIILTLDHSIFSCFILPYCNIIGATGVKTTINIGYCYKIQCIPASKLWKGCRFCSPRLSGCHCHCELLLVSCSISL